MSETIEIQFDPRSLPRWAQNDANVVKACERILSFRCNVFKAKTRQEKNHLKTLAALLWHPAK